MNPLRLSRSEKALLKSCFKLAIGQLLWFVALGLSLAILLFVLFAAMGAGR